MMDKNKILYIDKFKQKKEHKMLFIVIALGVIAGMVSWKFYIENIASLDVKIPASKNITFNDHAALGVTATQIANEIEQYDGKPILLYLYTTWCESCKRNFTVFNEIAQEFQETNLHIIAIAIDRDLTASKLKDYLDQNGEVYFSPKFLTYKEGFKEFLKQIGVNYEGRIPFTVLIGKDSKVIAKYAGVKNKNYLRNKIIRELYL